MNLRPGVECNVKKTYLLVTDNDKKRREQEPAPLLTINGETLHAMNLDDACKYLGYWGTGNGDMRATQEVVRQKIITPPKWQKNDLVSGGHGQAGSWRGQ